MGHELVWRNFQVECKNEGRALVWFRYEIQMATVGLYQLHGYEKAKTYSCGAVLIILNISHALEVLLFRKVEQVKNILLVVFLYSYALVFNDSNELVLFVIVINGYENLTIDV